jgi:NAD(P)-dependent dehydrogenase (short-subunit alcohol dehydrogenase family)
MEQLEGRVAVVTGAGSGIGRGIAKALSESGCHVVVTDIEEDSARSVAAALNGRGTEAMGLRLDVTDRDAVEALADLAWEHFGHVDILVNNAGVFPPMAACIDTDERNARWVLEVNVMGVWYGCAAFARRFVAQSTDAHILTTGSENSLGMAHTGAAFYTASKQAVLGMSDVLRYELPEFVGVSVLCPGMVVTNLSNSARNRPERFGGPTAPAPTGGYGMDADEVGRRAVDGIRRGDFFIVTHPPVRQLVEERAAEALGAFDAQAPRYPGDEALDTRKLMPPRRSRTSGTTK